MKGIDRAADRRKWLLFILAEIATLCAYKLFGFGFHNIGFTVSVFLKLLDFILLTHYKGIKADFIVWLIV